MYLNWIPTLELQHICFWQIIKSLYAWNSRAESIPHYGENEETISSARSELEFESHVPTERSTTITIGIDAIRLLCTIDSHSSAFAITRAARLWANSWIALHSIAGNVRRRRSGSNRFALDRAHELCCHESRLSDQNKTRRERTNLALHIKFTNSRTTHHFAKNWCDIRETFKTKRNEIKEHIQLKYVICDNDTQAAETRQNRLRAGFGRTNYKSQAIVVCLNAFKVADFIFGIDLYR